MRSIFTSLAAVAFALPAANAYAQAEEIHGAPVGESAPAQHEHHHAAEHKAGMGPALDQGWNKDWALLFSVNNFIGGNNGFLSQGVTGSIAGTYILSPDTAIRGGVYLQRTHNAVQVTKNINTVGATEVTTFSVSAPSYTQYYQTDLRLDYIKRLMSTAVAPYAGAGAVIGWWWQIQDYTDDKSVVDQRTEQDNNQSAFNLGARGILGAEWRVHDNFAFFAEYNVFLTVWSKNRLRNRTTVESTVGGTTATNETQSQRDYSTWFNGSTGLAQGGSLGLEVLF